jgi:hypothetical protein
MAKKYRLVILFFLLFSFNLQAQFDARWALGVYTQLYFNDTVNVNPKIEKGNLNIIAWQNNSSICNFRTGELEMFCHGNIIYNKLGVPMENGDSLNSGQYGKTYYPANVIGSEGSLILPFPNHKDSFFVIYTNLEKTFNGLYLPDRILYSLVDMNKKNGLGKVVNKDLVLKFGDFEIGRINAIQHANGRDWWIIQNGFQDLLHYIYLLDPMGVRLYTTQTIGTLYNKNTPYEYQTCVNQSGNQIAYLYSTQDNDHQHRVDLYDFDRCSGLLYNYKTINILDSFELLGCAFSPNDSLLYINNLYNVFQLNLKNKFDTTIILVGKWDSTIDPVSTLFYFEKITPANEIIISTFGATRRLHCITKPNIRGVGCDFMQGCIKSDSTNHYFGGSLPNYPNFRLGVLKGSECDTIREAQPPTVSDGLIIYPNPSNEWLMLNGKWLMGNTNVAVYNIVGQKQLSFTFQNSKGFETINVLALANGMYVLQIIDAAGTKHNCKFVKE